MEQQQEKDYFWFYIGGLILFAVVFVFLMKGERSALEPGVTNPASQAESKAEVDKGIDRIHSQK